MTIMTADVVEPGQIWARVNRSVYRPSSAPAQILSTIMIVKVLDGHARDRFDCLETDLDGQTKIITWIPAHTLDGIHAMGFERIL